jgi:hypothetical protein
MCRLYYSVLATDPYWYCCCWAGLHWAHPHIHGSTALQTGTAHLAIVVEDDNALWLPHEAGCADVADVLSVAPDTILDLQLYFFRRPNPVNGTYSPRIAQALNGLNVTDGELKQLVEVTSDLNNGNYQYMSRQAGNPLCCDDAAGSRAAAANARSGGVDGDCCRRCCCCCLPVLAEICTCLLL